jgi:hypothetical protein
MIIAAALILTVLCFIAVAVPFFRNRDNSPGAWSYEFDDSAPISGTGRTMVKQLESDYRTGILSEEDYRSRQIDFKATSSGPAPVKTEGASGLDDEIEIRIAGLRGGGKAGADDEIEEKVRQLRRSGKPEVGDAIEEKVRKLRRDTAISGKQPASTGGARQAKTFYCPQCGAKRKAGDRFCARCGKQLT